MFDATMDDREIKLVHKTEGHEYKFPIRRDAEGGRSLALGVMAQNPRAKTSAHNFSEDARSYAEAFVITGKENRAIVTWYVDKANNNLKEVEKLLKRGWIVVSASALDPGEDRSWVAQSPKSSFWTKRRNPKPTNVSRYSRLLIVMREPRDREEVMRVGGKGRIYYALELSFSDEGSNNLEELNSRLNNGWTTVFVMPLSGPTDRPETGSFSTSRALVMLRF
jgi:hypothetical protein